MEVFLSIVGGGASGCELGFRRLKPLAWIFGKKGRHDAYGYVCFGDGGGSASGLLVPQRLLKRMCCVQNGDAMLRWLIHSKDYWVGTEKEQLLQCFKLLSERSLQSLNTLVTCELGWGGGGGIWVRKL